jgi:hypothetical protein
MNQNKGNHSTLVNNNGSSEERKTVRPLYLIKISDGPFENKGKLNINSAADSGLSKKKTADSGVQDIWYLFFSTRKSVSGIYQIYLIVIPMIDMALPLFSSKRTSTTSRKNSAAHATEGTQTPLQPPRLYFDDRGSQNRARTARRNLHVSRVWHGDMVLKRKLRA